MFVTIRNYKVPSDGIDEVVRRVDESWLEQVRGMKGFVSYQVVRTGDDSLTSLAVFLDGDDGRLAEEASAQWVGAHLMDVDVELQDTHRGPVVVHGGS